MGVAALVGLAVWLAPARPVASAAAAPASFAQVKAVVGQRCMLCHNAQVQNKGVTLHRPELIRQHAQAVYVQATLTRQMPLNNATQISEDERALIKRWFEAGAPTR